MMSENPLKIDSRVKFNVGQENLKFFFFAESFVVPKYILCFPVALIESPPQRKLSRYGHELLMSQVQGRMLRGSSIEGTTTISSRAPYGFSHLIIHQVTRFFSPWKNFEISWIFNSTLRRSHKWRQMSWQWQCFRMINWCQFALIESQTEAL
jgi:hypothetical protein